MFSRLSMYSPPHQLGDKHLVDGRLQFEIERLQRLVRREPRSLQSPLGSASFALDQFQLTQLQQIAQMVDVVGGAATRDLLALAEPRRQLQTLQMML